MKPSQSNIQQALNRLSFRKNLTDNQMQLVIRDVMQGNATAAQVGALLMGLRVKEETATEVTAAVRVLRELATSVCVNKEPLLDTCGTGGDGSNTFNVSTAVAIVVAAAGSNVAKHGNRSVSSSSGSADVLKELGVAISLTPEQVGRCIESIGIGFLFAPMHHKAMKNVVGPRQELGVRTIFNILGPLSNPANAGYQLIGVFDAKWVPIVAEVLQQLGTKRALVAFGLDGLDEISICGESKVAELDSIGIREYTMHPEDYGLNVAQKSELVVTTVAESCQKIKQVLANAPGACTDIVLLNAGAALYITGKVSTILQGIELARDTIASGLAKEKLQDLIRFTTICAEENQSE